MGLAMGRAYASQTATCCSNTNRKRTLCAKVLRHYRHTDNENTARAESDADSLGQHELIVLPAQRGHHQAQDYQERA